MASRDWGGNNESCRSCPGSPSCLNNNNNYYNNNNNEEDYNRCGDNGGYGSCSCQKIPEPMYRDKCCDNKHSTATISRPVSRNRQLICKHDEPHKSFVNSLHGNCENNDCHGTYGNSDVMESHSQYGSMKRNNGCHQADVQNQFSNKKHYDCHKSDNHIQYGNGKHHDYNHSDIHNHYGNSKHHDCNHSDIQSQFGSTKHSEFNNSDIQSQYGNNKHNACSHSDVHNQLKSNSCKHSNFQNNYTNDDDDEDDIRKREPFSYDRNQTFTQYMSENFKREDERRAKKCNAITCGAAFCDPTTIQKNCCYSKNCTDFYNSCSNDDLCCVDRRKKVTREDFDDEMDRDSLMSEGYHSRNDSYDSGKHDSYHSRSDSFSNKNSYHRKNDSCYRSNDNNNSSSNCRYCRTDYDACSSCEECRNNKRYNSCEVCRERHNDQYRVTAKVLFGSVGAISSLKQTNRNKRDSRKK